MIKGATVPREVVVQRLNISSVPADYTSTLYSLLQNCEIFLL